MCRVAAVKITRCIDTISADYILLSFWIIGFILNNLENRVLLKQVSSFAYYISGHEQTQSHYVNVSVLIVFTKDKFFSS